MPPCYMRQACLIWSEKDYDSAYRHYSEYTVKRIQQIIILRKLRIPLKQISKILESGNADYAIEVFERNLNEIEDEITALSTIKSIIQSLKYFLCHDISDSITRMAKCRIWAITGTKDGLPYQILWAYHCDKYEPNLTEDDGECMHGLLEEHLNFRNMYHLPGDDQTFQIDLLLPIRERKQSKE